MLRDILGILFIQNQDTSTKNMIIVGGVVRFLARDRIFEKGQNYMGFNLCPECYEYKTSNKVESVPDIEDIRRFGLSFNF